MKKQYVVGVCVFLAVVLIMLFFFGQKDALFSVPAGGDQSGQNEASVAIPADGSLAPGVWEKGVTWTVKLRDDNPSYITGIPRDVQTVLLRYVVEAKDGKAFSYGNGPVNAVYSYQVRESMVIGGNQTKDHFFLGDAGRVRVYLSVKNYSARGRPRTLEERYSYKEVDARIVSPSLASALSCPGCSYKKKDSAYSLKLLAEKHMNVSGIDPFGIYALAVYDGVKEVSVHVMHDSLPWPIYERIGPLEYFLMDYPGKT